MSIKTSRGFPERPGTTVCNNSSNTGTTTQIAHARSHVPREVSHHALAMRNPSPARIAYSEKCAHLRMANVMIASSWQPNSSNSGRTRKTNREDSAEDTSPDMSEWPHTTQSHTTNAAVLNQRLRLLSETAT